MFDFLCKIYFSSTTVMKTKSYTGVYVKSVIKKFVPSSFILFLTLMKKVNRRGYTTIQKVFDIEMVYMGLMGDVLENKIMLGALITESFRLLLSMNLKKTLV